jgi:tetratricopeptide (TPR) repeat protein
MKRQTFSKRLFFLSIIFIFSFLFCFSQPAIIKGDPDVAKDFFDKHNYPAAIKCYLLLLKQQPDNVEYNQKIAESYLLSHSIKAKAIPHLEKIIKQASYPDVVWLDLGNAYHFANKFEEAINAYNKYKSKIKDKNEIANVERLIEQCHNGAELIKRPLNITYENLGKTVNSEFPEYYPIVSPDENILYFTTRRKTGGAPEFDGYFPSDIYSVPIKNGKPGKAQSIGNIINTNLDEEAVDISDDGTIMLFYIDHTQEFGDIWISRKINSKTPWLKPERLPDNINEGLETSASIWKNPATDEEVLLVASSRPGTSDNPNYGETDIYISRKLPTGNWSEPKNLGPNINTKYKEEFPKFSSDGKTIYFASQGHSSMGGFDIFKSVWDEVNQTWSEPKNLGYPINTSDDDLYLSFCSGGRIAYQSCMREGGLGDLDIYRLVLQDVEAKETIYKGYITSTDTVNKISRVKIEIVDKKSNDLQGVYIPDPNNCYYVMALTPGKWIMKVEAPGYETYSEDITIFDEVLKFSPEVTKNIKLKKQ